MSDTTTLNETTRTLDGTEYIRLATAGANWKTQISSIETFFAAPMTSVSDTNVTLTLGGSPATSLLSATSLTMGWTGTLAAGRLNANVVQAVTNDTNVTGSIASQTLTLGWTGTLAAGRLNANVVQSVVNDTNVTGSITSQALTLGWTGTLAVGRGGTGDSTLTLNGVLYGNGTSAVSITAQGAANTVLWANAGAPSFVANPVIGTSVTCPLIIGGTAAGSTLTLQSTSGAGTSDAIIFQTASQLERARLDTGGSLNIGNVGAIILDHVGNAPKLQVAVTNTDNIDTRRYSADPIGSSIIGTKSRGATIGTNTVVVAGDGLLQLLGVGYDNTGTPVQRASAAISLQADATPTVGSVPGRIVFQTVPSGSTTLTEAARIDANQNFIFSTAALATNATNGFLYVDSCAGAPTGTPTSYSGRVPLVFDTTNNNLWMYDAGWQLIPATWNTAWSSTTPTPTPGGGAFTTATATVRVAVMGKTAHVRGQLVVTTLGTASGAVTIPLPFTVSAQLATCPGICVNVNTAVTSNMYFNVNSANLTLNITVAAQTYIFAGVCEIN
jgi:hypothetical protein